jgi:transcriptional regulator with XRE-family HTH domain
MGAEWFAGRLRELRAASGLSRQELADKAGLKFGGVRDLEQGLHVPGWDTVLALAAALGVGVEAFTTPPAQEAAPPARGRPRKDAEEVAPAKEKASGKGMTKGPKGKRRKGE